MELCLCLTIDNKRCTRSTSKKPNADHRFCWQHQKCKKLYSTKISSEQHEKLQKAINFLKNKYGECALKKWTPIKIIGAGMQSNVFQVCQLNKCDYILKMVSPKEAELSIEMGKTGLSPIIYDNIQCGDKIALIAEKMDGDLSDFLYPPQRMNEIMPQVLDIIYKLIADHKICHKDTKVNNFLWKKINNHIKIYIADFGIATECPQKYANKEGLEMMLRTHLSIFNMSFVKPELYGVNAPENITDNLLVNDKKYESWIKNFLINENEALKNDQRWFNMFDSVEYFAYGDMINDFI